ncbi:MAG: hypothetical protein ACI8PZ_006020 [Myxococcota bacterium]|jgi:hypothetical protein
MRTLIFLLASGCTEYGISPQPKEERLDTATPGSPVSPSTTPSTPTPTTPPACPADAPPGYDVSTDDACAQDPIIGSFDPVVEWHWESNPVHPGYDQVMSAPAAGPLVDTDGDGDADGDDVPVVLFTTFTGGSYRSPGALNAVDGATGATLWSVRDLDGHTPQGCGGVAVGDLDGTGPKVFVAASDGLLAVNPDGSLAWHAPTEVAVYGAPALADLDGDGVGEVVFGRTVVNADGTIRWTGTGGQGNASLFNAVPVDLDGDGVPEIVAGNTVYNVDGSTRWQDAGADGQSAVADMDLDGAPEIVLVYSSTVRLLEADGTEVWTVALPDGGGGPPTIADFDGDGAPEIGVASREVYRVLEADGSERWANVVQDFSSSVTGSSVFDFEGDGAAEVVYADEQTLWVYDGATGAVELEYTDHSSGTLYEYPLIVDVDGDGATEIVVSSNDYNIAGSRGITVVGDAADSWVEARRVWNQHAYNITNVDDDGRVPARPRPNWPTYNSFRAGNSETKTGLGLPDLVAGPPVACTDECSLDRAVLWFPVENTGKAASGAFELTVYADRVPVGLFPVADLRAGDAIWLGPLTVDREAWGAEGLVVQVDEERRVNQCDPTDDRAQQVEFPCDASHTGDTGL